MSNKTINELESEADDIVRLALKAHQEKSKRVNDTEDMQAAIALAEELRRESNPNFKHYPDATYEDLGLLPPARAKKDIKALKQSSEEDTFTDTQDSPRSESATSSPRNYKTQPSDQEMDYSGSEETGYTVDVQEFYAESDDDDTQEIDPNKISATSTRDKPTAELPQSIERKPTVNKAVAQPSSAVEHKPVVQQSWAQKSAKAKETTPAEAMRFLIIGAKTLDLKKSPALTDALIDAEKTLRENNPDSPSNALKGIMAGIGKKTLGNVVKLDNNETAFLRAIMKMNVIQDVIKDRKCLNALYDKAQSLPRTKRGMILDQLESVKTTAPTPTGPKK